MLSSGKLPLLLHVAVVPMLRVMLLSSLGAFLASRRINLLNEDARKHLNKMIFMVFFPALVFCKLGEAVTLQNMVNWWFMPVNVIIGFTVGGILGCAVVFFLQPPTPQRRLIIASCAMGNLGNLPLVLVSSLCDSGPHNPFGSSAFCDQRGMAYAAYSLWMSVVLMWTVVFNLLRPTDEDNHNQHHQKEPQMQRQEHVSFPSPFPPRLFQLPLSLSVFASTEGVPSRKRYSAIPHDTSTGGDGLTEETAMQIEVANLELKDDAQVASPQSMGSDSDQGGDTLPLHSELPSQPFSQVGLAPAPKPPGQPPSPSARLFPSSLSSAVAWMRCHVHLEHIFTPPTSAALLALALGSYPPVKSILFGPAAPLRLIIDTGNTLGTATIPCVLLVLGANLAAGPSSTSLSPAVITAISLSRLVLLPTLGILIVLLVDSLGFLPPNDPLFRFILLLQFGMPTAINLGTVAAIHNSGEKEASIILFWQYLFSFVTITFFMGVYLSILL